MPPPTHVTPQSSNIELVRYFGLLSNGLPSYLMDETARQATLTDTDRDPFHIIFSPNYVSPFFFRLGRLWQGPMTLADFKAVIFEKVFKAHAIDKMPSGAVDFQIKAGFPGEFYNEHKWATFTEENVTALWELCNRAVEGEKGVCGFLSVDWVWADGKVVSPMHQIVDDDREEDYDQGPKDAARNEREFRHRKLHPRYLTVADEEKFRASGGR